MKRRLPRKRPRSLRRRALLIAGAGGKIQFTDPTARRWLRRFFGRSPGARVLPRSILKWMSTYSADHRRRRSLVAKTRNEYLYLKREPSYSEDNLVLLFELINGKSKECARRHRQLTSREREVLFWVARGKTNAEAGAILRICSSTVGKHLERIYAKLGVENRTAASSFGFESPNLESS